MSREKLRIAFIVHAFPAMSETFILHQITGLIDLGHDVDIYSLSKHEYTVVHKDFIDYELERKTFYVPYIPPNWFKRGVKALCLLFTHLHSNVFVMFNALNIFKYGKQSASLRLFYNVIPFLSNGPYDIVHVHFGMNGCFALNMLKLNALTGKLVVTFHGYDVNVWPNISDNNSYSKLFLMADLLTVSSNFINKRLIELGADNSKIRQIPVGVDLDKFSFKELPTILPPIPVVLTVARLVEVKGLEYSIAAFAKVLKFYPNAIYWVVGDGPLLGMLKELVGRLDISQNVVFWGAMTCDELIEVYAKSHIFLLTGVVGSDGAEEGQGVVLLEAQAVGLPVIASRVGGIPESVVDGETGFLVEPKDIEAIADKMIYLFNNYNLCRVIGKNGRAHVYKNYNIKQLNELLVNTYKEIVSG